MSNERRAAGRRKGDSLDEASVYVSVLDTGLDAPLDCRPDLITPLLGVLCVKEDGRIEAN